MHYNYNRIEKNKREIGLDAIKALSTIFVVLVHAGNLYGYAQATSDFVGFAYDFFGIFSAIGVPCFFAVSGFLASAQYKNGKDWYCLNAKKKIRSLLIPYAIWISVYWILERIMLSGELVFDAQAIASDLVGIPFVQNPLYEPLWFIRDLFLVTFLLPFIKVVSHNIAICLLWCGTIWVILPSYIPHDFQEVFTWYVVGVLIQSKQELFILLFEKLNRYLKVCILLAFLGGLFAVGYKNIMLKQLVIALWVIIIWSAFNAPQNQNNRVFLWLNKNILPASFVIFVTHGKVLSIIQIASVHFFGTKETVLLFGYFLYPVVVITACVLFDKILRMTPVYGILTGNRM